MNFVERISRIIAIGGATTYRTLKAISRSIINRKKGDYFYDELKR
jgi:hypothetical protein